MEKDLNKMNRVEFIEYLKKTHKMPQILAEWFADTCLNN